MYYSWTFIRKLFAIAALTIAVVVGCTLLVRAQTDAPVPAVVEPCLDRSSPFAAGGATLMATKSINDVNYYLIYTYENSSNSESYPSALLVSETDERCTVELWNTPGDFLAYADYVPFDVAVKFREIEFSRQLDRLGRESFIDAFNVSEQSLLDEEVTALEHLGVLDDIKRNES
jgi:hypothetical protein